MNKFEKLEIYKKSLLFLKEIYLLSSKLPKSEERNLIDQIKRAATSVILNIAEGSESENDKEFKRYLIISKKSITEVIAVLKIINFLYKIKTDDFENQAEEIKKMINGLIKYLKKSLSS